MRAFFLGALAALAVGRAARAATLAQKRRELLGVQKQLEATRREIDEYRRLEENLGQDLQKLESRNAQARQRMSDLQGNLKSAEKRRAELRARLSALGQASGYWRSALDSEVRLYAAASFSADPAFGADELRAEDLRRAAILEKAQMLGRLKGFSRKTQQAAEETTLRAQRLRGISLQAQAEQQSSQQQYQATKAAIAQAQERRAQAMQRAKELEDSAKALTSLVRSLGHVRRQAPSGPAKLEVPPHSLAWPAEGEVVRAFGRQKNPELETWVINQGILLATPAAAAVTPVQKGRVIFAGPFRSYGQVLIVDHGDNFFSIYGELGRILASKGAEVRPGQTIARAGRSSSLPKAGAGRSSSLPQIGAGGASEKGSVYLEIRRGTEALDPAMWLRPR